MESCIKKYGDLRLRNESISSALRNDINIVSGRNWTPRVLFSNIAFGITADTRHQDHSSQYITNMKNDYLEKSLLISQQLWIPISFPSHQLIHNGLHQESFAPEWHRSSHHWIWKNNRLKYIRFTIVHS